MLFVNVSIITQRKVVIKGAQIRWSVLFFGLISRSATIFIKIRIRNTSPELSVVSFHWKKRYMFFFNADIWGSLLSFLVYTKVT